MTTPAFTLPAARRSYVHIPRRDLVLSGGDDLVFKVALVQADRPDAAKVELRNVASALYLTIWHCSPSCWDYGAWRLLTDRVNVLQSVKAVPDATTLGLCRFTLPRGALSGQGRRLSYSIAYDDGDMRDLCWGNLHVQPSLIRGLPDPIIAPPVIDPPPATGPYLLNDDFTLILDDNSLPMGI